MRRRRGVALAETALVLGLLCMVTLGAFQYGWYFYALQHATNAARQAARTACVLNGTITQGEAAATDALGTFFSGGATITLIETSVEGRAAIEAKVFIPIEKAKMLPLTWLPLPEECGARVTMAKEG